MTETRSEADGNGTSRIELSSARTAVRRPRRARNLTRVGTALGLLVALAGTFVGVGLALPVLVGLVVVVVARLSAWTVDPDPGRLRGPRGSWELDGDRLVIRSGDRTLRVAAGEVREGWIERSIDGTVAVLRLRDETEQLALVDDEVQLRRLMQRLGVDARAVRMKLRPVMRLWRVGAGCALSLVAMMGLFLTLLTVLVFLAIGFVPGTPILGAMTAGVWLLLVAGLLAAAPVELRIGRDGVMVKRPLRRRRFVPLARLGVATSVGTRVRIWDGDRPIDIKAQTASAAVAAVERIEAVRAGRGDAGGSPLALLERRGRSWAEWRQGLARLLDGQDRYRDSPIDPDMVARVLDDASQDPERRVGAALALASSPAGEPHRQRQRLAAEGTVEPALRRALERAAEGELEEAALEEAAALHRAAATRR